MTMDKNNFGLWKLLFPPVVPVVSTSPSERETTMTTDKNNFLNNGSPPRSSGAPRGLRGETKDVVFTSCSRCFLIDTQAMRNKILDLAMRGKLTEQLPEDGSAEELYRQIQKEKQAITKAGKRKKEQPLLEISDEEVPYALPSNWKRVRIGSILTLQAGKNMPASDIQTTSDENHMIPCYGGNGQRGFVGQANADGFHAIIGRQGALCGNINFAEGPFYATEHAVVVYGYAGTDMKWVGMTLRYLNLNQYATSVAQPGLAVNKIDNVPMPFPPLAEQHRIVEKIEEAFSVLDTIDALQAQYADNLTALKSKLLEAAVQGQLVPRGPEPWETVKLGDIAESVNVGIVIRPTRYYVPLGEGTPAFRNCNIQQGFMDDSEWVWLNTDAARENPRAVVKTGDILVARSGTPGNCCIVPEACDGWGAVDIVIVRLRQDLADPRYVKAFICSPTAQKAFLSMSRGVALTHLGATAVASLDVFLPPLAEQKRIVTKLEALLPLCERLR